MGRPRPVSQNRHADIPRVKADESRLNPGGGAAAPPALRQQRPCLNGYSSFPEPLLPDRIVRAWKAGKRMPETENLTAIA